VYVVARRYKGAALARILDMEDSKSVIVFCRTRTDVDELTTTLNGRGMSSEAIHGGLSQEQRDRVLRRFRDGTLRMLVATDVAARGLDIDHVSHVVNFDLPTSPEVYVHRIGRTGRAGREGTAITMVDAREQRLIRALEAHTKRKLNVMTVPTVAQLREKRLAVMQTTLQAAATEQGLDRYHALVDALQETASLRDVAAFALKLLDAQQPGASDQDVEIPTERFAAQPELRKGLPAKPGLRPMTPRPREPHAQIPNPVKLYVTLGRRDGIRPGDLVGAIANLASIEGRSIGSITLSDRFSLVEVPQQKAQNIIDALRGATIRGKKVSARFDREDGEAPAAFAPHTAPRRTSTHVAKPKRDTVPA
jgi:ATP-dependent RNA helicase DeaD